MVANKFKKEEFAATTLYVVLCLLIKVAGRLVENFFKMEDLEELISKNKIVVFSKSTCAESKKVTELLSSMKFVYKEVQLDKLGEKGIQLQEALIEKTGQKTLPNTFVKGWHVGAKKYTSKCAKNGTIRQMLDGKYEGFDYDLMVIGEGPGATMAALESARLGMKVAFCHYDVPTVENRRSGVTQRRMNLVCDPNIQIQRAGIISTHITDASQFGWAIDENVSFDWGNLINSIQSHARDINSKCVKYSEDLLIMCLNASPNFQSENVVKLTDQEEKETMIKARHFIIASSTKAEYFHIPGSSCCIIPEDIFYLPFHPGRVLVIGCTEAGLRCAGILTANNIHVTLLAGKNYMEDYDQQMIDRLIEDLSFLGAKVYKNADLQDIEIIYEGKPGEYVVTISMDNGEVVKDKFNTMVYANGRLPDTKTFGFEKIGVECEKTTWKIVTDEQDRTTVKNILALGSICKTKHIQSFASRTAILLVQKLYGAEDNILNIIVAPSLLSSSLDYGFVGLSEEQAMDEYGSDNIEVYHTEFTPLEYRFSSRYQKCYVKLVCVKSEDELVVGLHMTGPYAGDVVQGFALGIKLKAKKSDFENVIGIHPTTAEELTGKLRITKSSRKPAEQTAC